MGGGGSTHLRPLSAFYFPTHAKLRFFPRLDNALNTSKKEDCKIAVWQLALQVLTFDKVINELGTKQTRNAAVLWYFLD